MLLFRADEYRTLELCRALAVEKVSMKIQALARANLTRRYLDKVKAVRPQLTQAVESRNLERLDQALLLVSEVLILTHVCVWVTFFFRDNVPCITLSLS